MASCRHQGAELVKPADLRGGGSRTRSALLGLSHCQEDQLVLHTNLVSEGRVTLRAGPSLGQPPSADLAPQPRSQEFPHDPSFLTPARTTSLCEPPPWDA